MKLVNMILIVNLIFLIGCSREKDISQMKPSKESEVQKKMENTESNKYLEKAKKLSKAYWGKGGPKENYARDEYAYVKSVKPKESKEITKLLSDYKVFGVEVYNPISQIAGRPFYHYSLALRC